ncbi:helix-turn-helix domain-containing protein [Microbacterium sp. 1.5R]|uniref:helix-turn-helix domain-containing protein n=1 Tax=Microbacterium sp. 1.5R TaxID=1916917 RepID=UPI00164253D7|nr:helix-turn-helix domain-containing protein [Microbacterium sp. 1.5R]
MKTIDLRERCLDLIDKHYWNRHVGPAWLARELFVSRRQLDRAFSGHPSVAEVLARRRLLLAVTIAAHEPDTPMVEIARRCGYGTYETFRAHCHRYLRRSPREARDDRIRALGLGAARAASLRRAA